MPIQPARSQALKRGPYASRACLECQRRKTKCNEEQPCPHCRARQVECRYCEPDSDRPSPAKRLRGGSRAQAQPTTQGISAESQSFAPASDGETNALREEIRQLRRDVDLLSSFRDLGPSQGNISNPATSHYDRGAGFVDLSPSQGADQQTQQDTGESLDEIDTFDPLIGWDSPIAIANKIGAIRGDFQSTGNPPDLNAVKNSKTFRLSLPGPQQLKSQIDLFLSGIDDYSPYFRRSAFQKRVASSLHSLAYGVHRTTIHVTAHHCTTFAILCGMLSNAEVFSLNSSTLDPSTGRHWFQQAKRIMEEFQDSIEDSLDVVVYHMLVAGYLMEAERLRPAALHVVRASHAALSIGLNDQTRWKPRPDEIVSRPCLWWVLYFLEKRIHWKCGIAYLLRPSEVNVPESLSDIGDPEIETTRLYHIESMISYSQLWTSIWQDFLAPKPPLAGQWMEVQLRDAKIMITYQQLHPSLLWDTDKVDEYFEMGVNESGMRQKLHVYLWYQSLRLTIRQGRVQSSKGDQERQRSCLSICKDIIAAIETYMKRFVCMRPLGYFLVCCLVECVFYIKHEQSGQQRPTDSGQILETLGNICTLLETLSVSVGSGQRALAALRCVLLPGEQGSEFDVGDLPMFPSMSPMDSIRSAQDPYDERVRAFPGEYFDAFDSDASLAETLHFLGLVPV